MPRYDFVCQNGHTVEDLVIPAATLRNPRPCPVCGGALHNLPCTGVQVNMREYTERKLARHGRQDAGLPLGAYA